MRGLTFLSRSFKRTLLSMCHSYVTCDNNMRGVKPEHLWHLCNKCFWIMNMMPGTPSHPPSIYSSIKYSHIQHTHRKALMFYVFSCFFSHFHWYIRTIILAVHAFPSPSNSKTSFLRWSFNHRRIPIAPWTLFLQSPLLPTPPTLLGWPFHSFSQLFQRAF